MYKKCIELPSNHPPTTKSNSEVLGLPVQCDRKNEKVNPKLKHLTSPDEKNQSTSIIESKICIKYSNKKWLGKNNETWSIEAFRVLLFM